METKSIGGGRIRIAICEDHSRDMVALRGAIEAYFSRRGYAGKLACFATGEDFLCAFSPGAFDIVFLDVFLPGLSGIEVARKIREADRNCLILFITISLDHAMDGFEVQASGYVVKPIDGEKIDKALYMCREVLDKNGRVLQIPAGREGSLSLPLINIQYIEVYGRSSLFHMHGGVFEAHLTLNEIEQALGGVPFLRCHRSYIVNMNYVARIEPDSFFMENGELVPIRKNGRKEVKNEFAQFLIGQSIKVEA